MNPLFWKDKLPGQCPFQYTFFYSMLLAFFRGFPVRHVFWHVPAIPGTLPHPHLKGCWLRRKDRNVRVHLLKAGTKYPLSDFRPTITTDLPSMPGFGHWCLPFAGFSLHIRWSLCATKKQCQRNTDWLVRNHLYNHPFGRECSPIIRNPISPDSLAKIYMAPTPCSGSDHKN